MLVSYTHVHVLGSIVFEIQLTFTTDTALKSRPQVVSSLSVDGIYMYMYTLVLLNT